MIQVFDSIFFRDKREAERGETTEHGTEHGTHHLVMPVAESKTIIAKGNSTGRPPAHSMKNIFDVTKLGQRSPLCTVVPSGVNGLHPCLVNALSNTAGSIPGGEEEKAWFGFYHQNVYYDAYKFR